MIAPQPLPTSSTFASLSMGIQSTMFSRRGERWYRMGQTLRSSMMRSYSAAVLLFAMSSSSSSMAPSL